MAVEWFYSCNQQQRGPVSWDALCDLARSGRLQPSDLVWRDGMSDWVRASTQGLFGGDRVGGDRVGGDRVGGDRVGGDRVGGDKAEFVPRDKADFLPSTGAEADDDRPRRRRQPHAYEEDDYDDRPRQRRRPSGMPAGLKIGLIVGGVVLLLLVVGVALFFGLKGSGGGAPRDIPAQGLVYNDILRMNDSRDKKLRNPCKIYNVNFVANSNYIIEHRSGAFDAYLRLEDPSGRQVAADDDGGAAFGGGRLDARIAYTARQTGTHCIYATCLDSRVGNFVLTVRKN